MSVSLLVCLILFCYVFNFGLFVCFCVCHVCKLVVPDTREHIRTHANTHEYIRTYADTHGHTRTHTKADADTDAQTNAHMHTHVRARHMYVPYLGNVTYVTYMLDMQ